MNIIELAKQAGWIEEAGEPEFGCFNLEAFAKMVAAQEREECAKVCEGINKEYDSVVVESCADAIRERGTT